MWIFSLEYQILNDFPSNVLIRIPFTFPPFLPGPAFVIIPAMQSSVWGQLAGIFDPPTGVRWGTRQGERVSPCNAVYRTGNWTVLLGLFRFIIHSFWSVFFFFFFSSYFCLFLKCFSGVRNICRHRVKRQLLRDSKNKVTFFPSRNDSLWELRRLFTVNLALVFLAATYLSWVVRCCSKGRLKAKKSADPTSCNSDDLSRRRFQTPRDRLICRHAERICCVKEMQKLSCQSGKYEAT